MERGAVPLHPIADRWLWPKCCPREGNLNGRSTPLPALALLARRPAGSTWAKSRRAARDPVRDIRLQGQDRRQSTPECVAILKK